MTKEKMMEMLKADLMEKGLPLAEDAIMAVVDSFEKVITAYIVESPSKIDDMAMPIVASIIKAIKAKADMIDGVQG